MSDLQTVKEKEVEMIEDLADLTNIDLIETYDNVKDSLQLMAASVPERTNVAFRTLGDIGRMCLTLLKHSVTLNEKIK